jgi:hypothetical protein
MKNNAQKIQEVENKLDGIPKLECSYCISERITEGKWDRFGTTEQQELEATCDKHLAEGIVFYKSKDVPEKDVPEWEVWAAKLAAERERRENE